jgi:hypothetical protein
MMNIHWFDVAPGTESEKVIEQVGEAATRWLENPDEEIEKN